MPHTRMSSLFASALTPSSHPACLLLLTWILSASPPALRAQTAGSPAHPNFIFARYASLTTLSLYGGYGQGKWLGFFGMIQNPRTR